MSRKKATSKLLPCKHPGPRVYSPDHCDECIKEWLKEQGLRRDGPSVELYWTGPAESEDSAAWRTEVRLPVADAG